MLEQLEGHWPIGVIRHRKGMPSLNKQKDALAAAGVISVFRLGVDSIDDVLRPFYRRNAEGTGPEPTVLVSPYPAIIGKDWKVIFKGLDDLEQSLYDLTLARFVNVKGAADVVFFVQAGQNAQAAHARQAKEDAGIKGGRPSKVGSEGWRDIADDWCDPDQVHITNEDIAANHGISYPAISHKLGGRKACIAARKPVNEGWIK